MGAHSAGAEKYRFSKGLGITPQILREGLSGPMRHPVLLSALIATVLAGAGLFFVQDWVSGTREETARMAEIADQLPPDPAWKQNPDTVDYTGFVCRPFTGCAGLQRRWQPVQGLDAQSLQKRIDAAGWGLKLEGDCIREPETSGKTTLCSAEGHVQGYEVWLNVVSESSYRPESELILNIF